MTPQETALVTTLLDRLKTTGGEPKDPDAETLIRETTAEQPDTAYYLAQTVLIHDLSLHSAQNRIAELEKSLAEAKTPQSPPTSFLGGLVATDQPAFAARPGDPALSASDGGVAGRLGAGSFLRAAAATAAGVAGGALLFEGVQSMLGHHDMAGTAGGRDTDAANRIGQDYASADDSGGSERT
jgi:uncharacterized protein